MYKRNLSLSIILIFFSLWVWATPNPVKSAFNIQDVEQLIVSHTDFKVSETTTKLRASLRYLQKKQNQYKNAEDFAEYLYHFVHRKYLKEYKNYTTFAETVVDGAYDCLTGSAVYSLFLSELNIDHSIVETNYHIYLLVYPGTGKEILLESTDPLHGFVTDQDEIEELKKTYAAKNVESRDVQVRFDMDIEHQLEGKELIGLLFYNQSIKYVNQGQFNKARYYANQALKYYNGNRITNLIEWLDTSYISASI